MTSHEEIVRLLGLLAQGRVYPLKETRRAAVQWTLKRLDGNVSQAAQMLGISRGTIYRYAR